jgi:hypothetical protein
MIPQGTAGLIYIPLYLVMFVLYVGDEARRAIGLGPAVTKIEAELVDQPTADPSQRVYASLCIGKDQNAHIPDGCLYRSYAPWGRTTSGALEAGKWSFHAAVDAPPANICLIFFSEYWEGGTSPIGSTCLSDVPSPGTVHVSDIECSWKSNPLHDCNVGSVTREAVSRP